ncbi:MAG: hypothetical protein RLZZ500_2443 [Bacteroidota bacterium]|jgi:hypothetical protein
MKEYFKHDKGYLLINEEAFFLTSSGNWSETTVLTEKSKSSIQKNRRRADRMYYYIGTLIVLCLFVFYKRQFKFGFGGIAGIYFVWYYLKNETAFRFKIPHAKIIQIEILDQNNLQFHFYNEMGERDSENIQHLELKGIEFLQSNFNNFLKA